MDLTDGKLMADYAYVSDPNFVKMLWSGTEDYDYVNSVYVRTSICPVYGLDLVQLAAPSSDDATYYAQLDAITGGRFIKKSEAATVESMVVGGDTMLSLDGLQYFTGLKHLDMTLGMDLSSPMTLKALRFDTLTQLEDLTITQSQLRTIDLSHNSKLTSVALGAEPNMTAVTGLSGLTQLQSFEVQGMGEDAALDFSGLSALKHVYVNSETFSNLNLSGLDLEYLYLSVDSMDGVQSTGLSCDTLYHTSGLPFPAAVSGVKFLDTSVSTSSSIASQFSQMGDLEEVTLFISDAGVVDFTSAQDKVEVLSIAYDNTASSATGWPHLTALDSLYISGGYVTMTDMDFSGTALRTANITANSISGLTTPNPMEKLVVEVNGGISYAPTGLQTLVVKAGGNVVLGDSEDLKTLQVLDKNSASNTLSLGSYSMLESLTVGLLYDVNGFTSVSYAASYPSLTTLSLGGRNIHEVPSATVVPALESLTVAAMITTAVSTGIAGVDLRQYSNLNNVLIGMLDMGSYYKNYNNRYYLNGSTYIRSTGAFILSPAQWAAVKAGNITLTGYSKTENTTDANDNPCTAHYINSVYGVMNGSETVTIADSDGSDGEITILVTSQTK